MWQEILWKSRSMKPAKFETGLVVASGTETPPLQQAGDLINEFAKEASTSTSAPCLQTWPPIAGIKATAIKGSPASQQALQVTD